MVEDDEGWSFVVGWLLEFLVGLETIIVTDGPDSVTGTDSEITVSTTGSGIAFCGECVVWVCVS